MAGFPWLLLFLISQTNHPWGPRLGSQHSQCFQRVLTGKAQAGPCCSSGVIWTQRALWSLGPPQGKHFAKSHHLFCVFPLCFKTLASRLSHHSLAPSLMVCSTGRFCSLHQLEVRGHHWHLPRTISSSCGATAWPQLDIPPPL